MPSAAADLTHDPGRRVGRSSRSWPQPFQVRRPGRRTHGFVLCTSGGSRESLIRHASFQASAVLALAVAVIVTSLRALLMAAIGLAELQAASFFAATGMAITLTVITTATEIKHRAASRKMTHALAKNGRVGNRHRLRKGALDGRCRSWEDDSWLLQTWRSSDRGPPMKKTPVADTTGVFFIAPPGKASYQLSASRAVPATMICNREPAYGDEIRCKTRPAAMILLFSNVSLVPPTRLWR